MTTITNQVLRVDVSEIGAEMQSLKLVSDDRELLWQGDAAYWHGRSPILFPAVGGLWNGHFRHNGLSYALPKHGFMRRKTWNVAHYDEDRVTLEYVDGGEDRDAFPWPYIVRVTYTLEGRTLRADFEVVNTGHDTFFFQMGGHPGFSLPDFDPSSTAPDGFLQRHGTPRGVRRAGKQGCTEAAFYDFPLTADGLVPLGVDTFAHEALIFDEHQLTGATLLDKQQRPLVRVESTAPVWLFWSPQGVHAPFVCAEPWYGLCDPIGFDGTLSERPYINRLDGGETWHGGYRIDVLL
jgi:galactose mutarotase-like enzyme